MVDAAIVEGPPPRTGRKGGTSSQAILSRRKRALWPLTSGRAWLGPGVACAGSRSKMCTRAVEHVDGLARVYRGLLVLAQPQPREAVEVPWSPSDIAGYALDHLRMEHLDHALHADKRVLGALLERPAPAIDPYQPASR